VTATSIDDRQETVSLIGSDKVEGTLVYGGMTARLELCSALWSIRSVVRLHMR
jgi:hypothetical protein